MMPALLSIIVPVFNSSAMLEELHTSIQNTLDGKQKFELILIDDGSKDGSWEKIEELKNKFPLTIKGIRLSKNFGQHNALLCGFSFAKATLYLLWTTICNTLLQKLKNCFRHLKNQGQMLCMEFTIQKNTAKFETQELQY